MYCCSHHDRALSVPARHVFLWLALVALLFAFASCATAGDVAKIGASQIASGEGVRNAARDVQQSNPDLAQAMDFIGLKMIEAGRGTTAVATGIDQRPEKGVSLLQASGVATGVATVLGIGLNMYRNYTREKALAQVPTPETA